MLPNSYDFYYSKSSLFRYFLSYLAIFQLSCTCISRQKHLKIIEFIATVDMEYYGEHDGTCIIYILYIGVTGKQKFVS